MIGIVDYGLGNLASVAGAIERLGQTVVVSADAGELDDADKLILPGVGAFGDGMRNLRDRGLVEPLARMAMEDGKPVLGICLGAQLMCTGSEEAGTHEGLGWVRATVRRLAPRDPGLRVPHVGWDDFHRKRDCLLFSDIPQNALFYYTHSYAIYADEPDLVVGTCDYGGAFIAALQTDNVYATQFHPEKSQRLGLEVLRNFVERI